LNSKVVALAVGRGGRLANAGGWPDITGIDYRRALLADQRREEAFWHLA
jgi:hypothetical protein